MPGESLKMLDVVALTADVPDRGLVRGQVGTIVEIHGPDVFEVEFCDDEGRTYALLPLKASQMMRLLYEPVEAA
jgi:hypothetical protein